MGAKVGVSTILLRDRFIGEVPAMLRTSELLAIDVHIDERERGAHHFIYDVDRFTKAVCLETDALIGVEQSL